MCSIAVTKERTFEGKCGISAVDAFCYIMFKGTAFEEAKEIESKSRTRYASSRHPSGLSTSGHFESQVTGQTLRL